MKNLLFCFLLALTSATCFSQPPSGWTAQWRLNRPPDPNDNPADGIVFGTTYNFAMRGWWWNGIDAWFSYHCPASNAPTIRVTNFDTHSVNVQFNGGTVYTLSQSGGGHPSRDFTPVAWVLDANCTTNFGLVGWTLKFTTNGGTVPKVTVSILSVSSPHTIGTPSAITYNP